jgi:hypothetical protein
MSVQGPYGIDHLSVFRKLKQVGDVIIFEAGYQQANEINVIAYNTDSHSYRLFIPGYRHTFFAHIDEVVPLSHPDMATIQWAIPEAQLSSSGEKRLRRVTVVIQNGQWHERVERIDSSGKTAIISEYVLKRGVSEGSVKSP